MENNLYIEISNLLLQHFSYLTEISMSYRNVCVSLLGIGIISLLVSLINYMEQEDSRSMCFAATLAWVFVIAGCIWYLEHDNNQREQQIQVQLTALKLDLEKLANRHQLDKDKVFNIAQDFLLCKKADLSFKHRPQFYFECTNKEYVSNNINYLMVQDNIKFLQTQISSVKPKQENILFK